MSSSASPQTPRSLHRDPNLLIVFGITLMAVLGVSSITPAFPEIGRVLHLSSQAVAQLITVFTLPGVFLAPLLGVLTDRWGREPILVPALIVFGLAGSGCALTRSFSVLLALRFVQGIGAAALSVLYITLLGDLYRGQERTAAMGCNASVLSVGTALYPAVGGGLATLGWQYPFLLAILAVPLALIVLAALENPEPTREQALGAYLSRTWESVKHVRVVILFLLTLMAFLVIYGAYLAYLPFLMERSFQASSWEIGLTMSAMSLATAVTSSQLGRLTDRLREKTLLQLACICYALALGTMPLAPTMGTLFIPVVLLGIGQGLSIPSLQTLLAARAPLERRGAFMAVNGVALRLGQTLGPILIGVVYSRWGVDGTFYAAACVAVGMIGLTLVMVSRGEG
jgi:MFS family permease